MARSTTEIVQSESGGDPWVGYTPPGQKRVNLQGNPLDQYGFPIWEGRMGPAGISHAAGKYQFQPATYAEGAKALGINDFSEASQDRVYNWTRAKYGDTPWAASAGGAGKSAGGVGKSAFPGGEGYNPETGSTQLTVSPQELEPPPAFLDRLLGGGQGQTEAPGEGQGGDAFLDKLLQPQAPPETSKPQDGLQTLRDVAELQDATGARVPPVNMFGSPSDAPPPLASVNQAATQPEAPPQAPQAPQAEAQGGGFLDTLLTQINPIGSAQAAEPPGQSGFDTTLTPPEEEAFGRWKQQYAPRDSGADYDLRGAFKAGLVPDATTGHWPDTFKKPNHPTFSDQSKYATGENAAKAGRWEGEKFIPPTAPDPGAGYLDSLLDGGMPPPSIDQSPSDTSGIVQPYLKKVLSGEMAREGIEDVTRAFSERDPIAQISAFMPTPAATTLTRGFAQRAGEAVKNAFSTPEWRAGVAEGRVGKEAARANIREQVGLSRQAKAQASAALEDVRAATMPGIPEFEAYIAARHAGVETPKPPLMKMLDHIEGAGKLPAGDPLRPVADKIKDVYGRVRRAIEAEIPDMKSFIDDYYRHMWKEKQGGVGPGFGAGKKGSAASLKERKIPTIGDGIEAGYTPAILDPIENTLHYVAGMHDYLAFHRAREIGKDAGYIKTEAEPGLVPLLGSGAPTYAPPGYAKMWNNYFGRGWRQWPALGAVYDKLLRAVNTVTAAKLGLSGFHAFTIAQETAVAGLAHSIGKLRDGELGSAMKEAGFSVSVLPKVREQYIKGKKLQEAYLGMGEFGPDFMDPQLRDFYRQGGAGPGSNLPPAMREKVNLGGLADLYARGGGRAVSRGHEYSSTAMSNYWQAWRRGALKMEMQTGLRNVLGGGPIAYAPLRAVGMFGREMARLMQTISAPLFDDMIPKIKFAAWADEMEAWMNKNPAATNQEQLAQSRLLMDSMDDRFGEMVQDNLFWNPILKQTLNLLATSVGWEYGSLRAFATGGKDVAKTVGSLAKGDLKGAGENLSTRARWLLSFPVIMAAGSAAYQYLLKGQPASETPMQDLNVPRTGGKTPEGAPERALLPGYQKDVLQWWHELSNAKNPMEAAQALGGIAGHKLNPAGQIVKGLATGKDALGRPIASKIPDPETHQVPSWYWSYAKYVMQGFVPIPFQQPRLKGTEIGEPERFVGIRPAPEWLQNPRRIEQIMQKKDKRDIKTERYRQQREKAREIRPGVP